jgi:hypothetical protein
MHPEYYSSRFYRRPRRFLWFILGGLAATWWFKHKECRERGYVGLCIRKPVHAAPGQDPRQAPSDNVSTVACSAVVVARLISELGRAWVGRCHSLAAIWMG